MFIPLTQSPWLIWESKVYHQHHRCLSLVWYVISRAFRDFLVFIPMVPGCQFQFHFLHRVPGFSSFGANSYFQGCQDLTHKVLGCPFLGWKVYIPRLPVVLPMVPRFPFPGSQIFIPRVTCFHSQGDMFLVPRGTCFHSKNARFSFPKCQIFNSRVPGIQFPWCMVFNCRVPCYHFQGARFSLLGCQFLFPWCQISIPGSKVFNTCVPCYNSSGPGFQS